MNTVQDQQAGKIWIAQLAYAERILQNFGMENAKLVNMPISVSTKLVKALNDCDDDIDQHMYQSAVGSLLLLSTKT